MHRLTGLSIAVEDVRGSTQSSSSISAASGGEASRPPPEVPPQPTEDQDSETRVLSFAELKELIEQGKTDQIPHNRKIPDVINVSPVRRSTDTSLILRTLQQERPSESKAEIRRKPWETVADDSDVPSSFA